MKVEVMRKSLACLILLFSWTLVAAQKPNPPCKPVQKPDWERDELRGRVRLVRTFKTWFRKNQESGSITKGKPKFEEETSYDSKGDQIDWQNTNYLPIDPADKLIVEYGCDNRNRLSEIRYKRSGDSSFRRTLYSYDEKNHDKEQAEYSAEGTLERLESYSYDDRGNRIEVIAKQQVHPEHFRPQRYDVYVTTRTTFEYDLDGKKTKEILFSADGATYATWLFSYDPQHRLIKETHIDKIGRFEDQFIYRYDRIGRLREEWHYANFCLDRNGQYCKGIVNSGDASFYYLTKTDYQYDRVGNWIQQRQFSMGGEGKTLRFEPDHNLSRKIYYYRHPPQNRRLERTRERASLLSDLGKPLKRNLRR